MDILEFIMFMKREHEKLNFVPLTICILTHEFLLALDARCLELGYNVIDEKRILGLNIVIDEDVDNIELMTEEEYKQKTAELTG